MQRLRATLLRGRGVVNTVVCHRRTLRRAVSDPRVLQTLKILTALLAFLAAMASFARALE